MVTSETVVTDEHPLAIEDDEVRYFFPYIYICIHHLGAFMTNIRPSFTPTCRNQGRTRYRSRQRPWHGSIVK